MVKKSVLRIGKFQKKKVNEVDYLLAKVSGKITGKQSKELRAILNQAVVEFFTPSE